MELHDCIEFEPENEDIRLVIGVDFGTTFSGFSYAYIKPEKEKIEIVVNQEWGHFKSPDKTNTVLQYDESYEEVVTWGADALSSEPSRRRRHANKPLPRPVEYFKFYLGNVPESKKPKLPPGITFDRAITDYLREMAYMKQKAGITIKESVKHWTGIDFYNHVRLVFTVPAEFTEDTKTIMRKCIYDAGLIESIGTLNLQFTTEPEAAAIHCINMLKDLELVTGADKVDKNLKVIFKAQIITNHPTRRSQDSNSAGQLSKDIGNLHKNLDKFCGLKKGIKINESEVKKLLRKFGCSIAGSKIHNSKNLISGVLERHVIETIIEKTQNYFNNDKGNKQDDEQDDEKQQSLEVKMVKTTEQLSKLTDSISKYRTGDEEVSKATSTKLRQQIYGVLGNRGFSNIAVGKEDKKHPLIATLQKDILDLMNCYRTITNPEKLSEIESIIDEIVRQVVTLLES
ncbi:9594_t:CDS:10 [Entrophospora sp. SA101]|nr:9594_t:CDS:10 [Entrophospora sp. SA101]